MAKQIPKTDAQKVSALEDHLFLLHRTVNDLLLGDSAHIRLLASQLRNLVSTSSTLRGVLWRRADDLNVTDTVLIRFAGNEVDRTQPVATGLQFVVNHLWPDGHGPAELQPAPVSLRHILLHHEPLFVSGEGVTHNALIKHVAEETGVSHDNEGVSRIMAKVNGSQIGDAPYYFDILYRDALFTLEVGERVLQAAAAAGGYVRRRAGFESASVAFKRFPDRLSHRLEVPSLTADAPTGTVFMVLDRSSFASASERPVRFPPIQSGNKTFSVVLNRRNRLEIRAAGLAIPFFCVERHVPSPCPNGLSVCVIWDGAKIDVFLSAVGEPSS